MTHLRHDLRAFEIEAEPNLFKTGFAHRLPQGGLMFTVKQQKPPTPRPAPFAALTASAERTIDITRPLETP